MSASASRPGARASHQARSGLDHTASPPRAAHTPGPWQLCAHLAFPHVDKQCGCGYRGVIFGPNDDKAICQPGHDPAPEGQEGSEPGRYPREVEIANARLISAAPELYEALELAMRVFSPAYHTTPVETSARQKMADALNKARGQ